MVVNCFRSLYLWVDLQREGWHTTRAHSCELLSFFVPLGWFTAVVDGFHRTTVLWIAFVLCTFGLIYSMNAHVDYLLFVVNCFRSLYLWVDLQQVGTLATFFQRCELLSFFVPLGWFTAYIFYISYAPALWIAFVLCTFGLIYSVRGYTEDVEIVVNCFRSLYLWVDLQPDRKSDCERSGCELLSFFVPLGWFTACG